VAIPHWVISLRNAPAHFVTWGVIGLARILPETATYRLGRGLALLTWNCFPRWQRTSLRNLELFYQHTPEGERPSRLEMRRIARDAAINLGYHTMEFIRMGRLPVERALEMVVEEHGVEHYFEALKLGRGVVGLAMHYGNWEMSGCYVSQRVKQLYAVGKEQRDDFFTRIVFPWREKFGVRNIFAGDKVQSTILRSLKENCVLGLLADQNGGRRGNFAPFCGIPASTAQGPAALALKTGAPILMTLCVRIAPGRLRMVVKPPLDTSGLPQDRHEALIELMTRMNAAYEAVIREDPTQWLWGHKRWKTRPPGEPSLY
jgi:Kdo2-lipid IVA lauroyltransferase/acyltransferase